MVKLDWLQDLLKETFFEKCETHGVYTSRTNKVNFYCFDCKLCLCSDCIFCDSTHRSHNHIEIHRYISQSCVRTIDVMRLNLVDISDIKDYNQRYNGDTVVLLHENKKPSKSVTDCCKNCHVQLRGLKDYYCSLACKVSEKYNLDISPKMETGSSVQTGSNPTGIDPNGNKMTKSELLRNLLKETFLVECEEHKAFDDIRKKAVEFYCFDCKLCLCSYCIVRDPTHRSHEHIQIKRYLSECCVRTTDIQRLNLIGISDIMDYICKGDELVLLHPKKISPRSVDYENKCKNCHVLLRLNGYLYCSLSCKASKEHNLDTSPETQTGSSTQTGSNTNQPIDLTEEIVEPTTDPGKGEECARGAPNF